MFKTTLDYYRLAAFLEGTTLLLLVGIAVPLKRLAGVTQAVTLVGSLHGVAYALYFAFVIAAGCEYGWGTRRILLALVASVVPFGTFVLGARLHQQGEASGV